MEASVNQVDESMELTEISCPSHGSWMLHGERLPKWVFIQYPASRGLPLSKLMPNLYPMGTLDREDADRLGRAFSEAPEAEMIAEAKKKGQPDEG